MSQIKPTITFLPVEKLKRGFYQPRREFDQESLAELAQSIRSCGLIQPIVVRPKQDGTYEIIAGERRWRASQLAGLDTIACIINPYTDEQAAAVSIIENLQRKNLNPIEEAQSLQRLIVDFGYVHEEIATIIGKSRVGVTNTLRLLRLDDRVQQLLISQQLAEGHGKVLAALSATSQLELAKKVIANAWSVRRLEQEVKNLEKSKSDTAVKKDPNIRYLERVTTQYIGAPVEVECEDQEKGWLKIRYFDHQTLKSILDKFGVPYEE